MLLTIIGAIIIFSLIIFVHELGHFALARLFKVNVNEFAIGMGPALFKKQGKKTLYSVRAIPIGGFCALEGEDDPEKENSFAGKKPLPRILILAAGAGMNLLLGFLIVTCLTSFSAKEAGGIYNTTVDFVHQDADASRFLQNGDKIIAINGNRVHIKRDVTFELSQNNGGESSITFLRDGKKITEMFTPTESDGVYIVGFNIRKENVTLITLLKESFYQTLWMVKLVFVSLRMLFTGGASISDLSGPIGVVGAMSTAAKSGILDLIFLAAFLSVNIGIMNLLPLPALDGGRILFAIFEIIFRKPVPAEKEALVHFAGMVILISFMLFATWNDLIRIFNM